MQIDEDEVVSVFELAENPYYNYFNGDFVICLSPSSEATKFLGIVNQLVGHIKCKGETRP